MRWACHRYVTHHVLAITADQVQPQDGDRDCMLVVFVKVPRQQLSSILIVSHFLAT